MELGGIPSAFHTLLAFAAFVIPGFLLRSGYVRSRATTANVPALYVLAEAVGGSLAVLSVAWWCGGEDILRWIQAGTLFQNRDEAYWFFLALLGVPYFAGALLGWLINLLNEGFLALRPPRGGSGRWHDLFYFLEVGGVFGGPTLWDDIWDEVGERSPLLVRVTTPTGREAVGAVENGTWADNSPRPRELFLKRLYRMDDQGAWEPVPGSEGMFFHEASIESLEFIWAAHPEQEVLPGQGPAEDQDSGLAENQEFPLANQRSWSQRAGVGLFIALAVIVRAFTRRPGVKS